VLIRINRTLAGVFAVLGAAMVGETAASGGGLHFAIGYLAGAAFLLLAWMRWRAVRPRR
jgi:hypothetical protein